MTSNENISPSVLNRIMKEVTEYTKNPVEDIVLQVNEENVTDLRAEITGPAQTPYEGGFFKIKLVFGHDFPSAPPKGFFITPIFHPNIAKNGEICVNTLKKDWKSDCKLSHILLVVRCLLIEPNPESALNEEAGRMFMEDYSSYSQRARLLTRIHGTKDGAGSSSAPEDAKQMSVDGVDSASSTHSPRKIGRTGKEAGPGDKKQADKKRSLKRL